MALSPLRRGEGLFFMPLFLILLLFSSLLSNAMHHSQRATEYINDELGMQSTRYREGQVEIDGCKRTAREKSSAE
jgi:hypothetical protein